MEAIVDQETANQKFDFTPKTGAGRALRLNPTGQLSIEAASLGALELKLVEEEIAGLRKGNPDAVSRAVNTAELSQAQEEVRTLQEIIVLKRELAEIGQPGTRTTTRDQERAVSERLREQRSTAQEIIRLEDQIAHASEDSADRQRLAHLSAIYNIQRPTKTRSPVRSRAGPNSPTRRSTTRSSPTRKCWEYLNRETKSISEIAADAKIAPIKAVFSGIEQGVDRLTKKLGAFGDILGSILKDLAKLAAGKLFEKLLGLSPQGPQLAFASGQQ